MKLSTILLLKKRGFSLNESFNTNKLFRKYNELLVKTLSFYDNYQRTNDYISKTGNYSLVTKYDELKTLIINAVNYKLVDNVDTFEARYKMLHYNFLFNNNFNNFITMLRYLVPLFKNIPIDSLKDNDFEVLTMKEFKKPSVRDQYMCFFENSKGELLGSTFANDIEFVIVPGTQTFLYPKAQYNGLKLSDINVTYDHDALKKYMDEAFTYITPYRIIYTNLESHIGSKKANFFTKEPETAKRNRYSYSYGQEDNQQYLLSDIHKIYALKISDLQLIEKLNPEHYKKISNRNSDGFYEKIMKPETYRSPVSGDVETHWKLQENRYRLLSTYTKILKEFDTVKERLDNTVDDCIEFRKMILHSQEELLKEISKSGKIIGDTDLSAFSSVFSFIESLMNTSYKVLVDMNKISELEIGYESPLINDANKINDQDAELNNALYNLKNHVYEINHAYERNRMTLGNAITSFEHFNDNIKENLFDINEITKFVTTNRFIYFPKLDNIPGVYRI